MASYVLDESKNAKRLIMPKTWAKYKGMYIGIKDDPTIKQNKNILCTFIENNDPEHYYEFPSDQLYKRRTPIKDDYGNIIGHHEIGEAKLIKGYKQTPLYANICNAWKDVQDYPQVSYGLKASRRDVLIIDSDMVYESINTAKETICKFCSVTKLPSPNYVLRNPNSGHIQLGWFLNKPFLKHSSDIKYSFKEYNAYNKELARIWSDVTSMEGDICFNGPACKNPFYKRFESYIYSEISANRDEMLNVISQYAYDHKLTGKEASKKRTIKSQVKLNTSTAHRNNLSNLQSRRSYEISNLRTWYFRQLNRGIKPSETDTFKVVVSLAKEASKITNRPIHGKNELRDIVTVVSKFCNENFNGSSNFGSNTYTDKSRNFGVFVQKIQKFIMAVKVLNVENSKLSTRRVAEKYGISQNTVAKYRHLSVEELNELAGLAKTFILYCRNLSSLTLDYKKKLIAIKSAYRAYKRNILSKIHSVLGAPEKIQIFELGGSHMYAFSYILKEAQP